MISPTLRLAIEDAWWSKGTTLQVAQRFKTHSRSTVHHIWHVARAAGRLPAIARPKGGFNPAIIFQGPFHSSFGFRSRPA